MVKMDPTTARLRIPKDIKHFLSGDQRMYAIVGPYNSGRHTIAESTLRGLGYTDPYWIESQTPVQLYEGLLSSGSAPLIVVSDKNITAAKGKDLQWYVSMLDALVLGKPIDRPKGSDDSAPAQVTLTARVLFMAEAQESYHPVWTKVPGVAFGESALDVYNYVRRKQSDFARKSGIAPSAFEPVLQEVLRLCPEQPVALATPTAGSTADISQVMRAAEMYANGDEDWKGELDRMQGGLRGTREELRLTQLHVLDGQRARLMMPEIIKGFLSGTGQFFSFTVRYPVILEGILDRVVTAHLPDERVTRVTPRPGEDGAPILYRALHDAKGGEVVIARSIATGESRSRDYKDVEAILNAVVKGEKIPKPKNGDPELPPTASFSGKLVLEDEDPPSGKRLQDLISSNPGVYLVDSFSDMVHHLSWNDESVKELVERERHGKTVQPETWVQYMDQLFSALERFPKEMTRFTRSGPHYQMLVQNAESIAERGLWDNEGFQIRGIVSQLRDSIEDDDDNSWIKRMNAATLPVKKQHRE